MPSIYYKGKKCSGNISFDNASTVAAIDTNGITGTDSAETTVQDILDATTEKVNSLNIKTAINNAVTESGDLTSSYSWSNYCKYSAVTYGKLVLLSVSIYQNTTGIPQNTTIATVPNNLKPLSETPCVFASVKYGSSELVDVSVYMDINGNIKHRIGGSNVAYMWATFVYMIA